MSNHGDVPGDEHARAVGASPAANADVQTSPTRAPFFVFRSPWQDQVSEKVLLIAGIIAISVCAFCFYLALESSVLHVSTAVFELPGGTAGGAMLDCGRVIAVVFFTFLGAISAYKISGTLTELALIQLVALNMVLHVILSMVKIDLGVLLTLWLCSWLAFAYGRLVKHVKNLRQQLIAKDFELERSAMDTSELTLELIKHDEFERRILAADLHDQVLNDLKLLREKLANVAADGRDIELDKELALIGRSMQQVREVMDDLSPTILEHLGFAEAVESCLRAGSERAGYKVRFRNTVDASEFNLFNSTEQTLIYRLVQECVTNICKHAQAKTVRCSISSSRDEVLISIKDDGKGISTAESTGSRGLSFMHRRAEIIGARVHVTTGEDGFGTCVDISLKKPDAKIGA